MVTFWVVMVTALLVFCSLMSYFIGYWTGEKQGYLEGAGNILEEWKKYMIEDDKIE